MREPRSSPPKTTLGERAQSILNEGVGFVPDKPKRVVTPRVPGTATGTWQERDVAKRREKRLKFKAERVMVDGHMVHPDAPHGSSMGTSVYCCCCTICRKANADRMRSYNHKKRAKAKNDKQ